MRLLFIITIASAIFQGVLPSRIFLGEFYNGEGYIFPENYVPQVIVLESAKARFTPDLSEVRSAEVLFLKNYDSARKADMRFSPQTSSKTNFRNWRRNYIGYIDDHGDKVVLIQLINFRKEKEALRNYDSWGKEFQVGFGDWFESNQSPLIAANITRSKLFIY
jgi:hypothetical protein